MPATPIELLRAFPLFRHAGEQTLATLAPLVRSVSYAHGQALWDVGELPDQAYFLSHGLVEIVRPTQAGEEVGLALFGPRECPGLFAMLDGRRFPAGARVLSEEARVLCVPREALVRAVDQDAEVSRAMSDVLRQHNAILRGKVDVVTAGEVAQRLATLLEVLGERFGDEQDGVLQIPLTLTRRVIARLVGARVETVIRVLSRWEKEQFVETTPEGFVVRSQARLHEESQR